MPMTLQQNERQQQGLFYYVGSHVGLIYGALMIGP